MFQLKPFTVLMNMKLIIINNNYNNSIFLQVANPY